MRLVTGFSPGGYFCILVEFVENSVNGTAWRKWREVVTFICRAQVTELCTGAWCKLEEGEVDECQLFEGDVSARPLAAH